MLLPTPSATGSFGQATPASYLELVLDELPITYTHPDGARFADITGVVRAMASNSGVKEGVIVIRRGEMSALVIQEARQFIEHDLMSRLKVNGRGISAFQPYQALPIRNGGLSLGIYQSVLAVMRNGKSELTVTPVPVRLETLLIDTGDFGEPVHLRKKSDYAKRGSEMVFDITELVYGTAGRLGQGAVYAGTGNTTCVLYHDARGEGAGRMVERMDAFEPPQLSVGTYLHNNLSARVNIPPDERQNGRAHVLAAMLQSSLTLPNQEGGGRIYLVELDGPRKGRTLHVGVESSAVL